jgi:hypothetical protein
MPADEAFKINGRVLEVRGERPVIKNLRAVPSECRLAPIMSGPRAKAFDVVLCAHTRAA